MGPVVKLDVYKAALALNDNKSVSITYVVAGCLAVCPQIAPRSWGAALPGEAVLLTPSSWL